VRDCDREGGHQRADPRCRGGLSCGSGGDRHRLKRQIDDEFLQLQIAATQNTVDEIASTQDDFRKILKYPRDEEPKAVIQWTATFVQHAHRRAKASLTSPASSACREDAYAPWNFPTAADHKELFADGEPLARLHSLGVRYKGQPLQGNPAGYLWLSGDFYVYGGCHQAGALLAHRR
jgi:hypothetical protein